MIEEIKHAIRVGYNMKSWEHMDNHIKSGKVNDSDCAQYGPLTINIARGLNLTVSKTRYLLNKYEKKGIIFKKNNKGGSCTWWYKGMINDIK